MSSPSKSLCGVSRRRWRVRGQVQGVGYRPFVYRLAKCHRLTGTVRNGPSGVTIEAQGRTRQLGLFAQALQTQCPPLASYDRFICESLSPVPGEKDFRIESSDRGRFPCAAVTVDTAVCSDCVAEMLAPGDRRYRYGLINCTNCGPRYSIIRRVPYDRPNTSMARFAMCPVCLSEYGDPLNRRFHAQPIACHDCGPQVQLVTRTGDPLGVDPFAEAARRLLLGQVLAIKGLGGFHLAVRADDPHAVSRLRRLKQRDAKPLALMCPTLDRARQLVRLSERAAEMMHSPACPVVLAPRVPDGSIADAVAPMNHRLGVMLPYTPIHHLLFDQLPSVALVMTSGNQSDDPLVIDNDEAVRRLGPLCDAILWHDRPIERRVDDSVFVDMGDTEPLPIRRARGYVPTAIPLVPRREDHQTHGLCVGGELKNTVAVVRDGEAILSHHMGDLTHPLAFEHFKKAIGDLCDLFGVEPRWIAYDLHPQYLSTFYARSLAQRLNAPLIGVQHHHAHAAAVMAEHGESQPVLAVVCDGTGYGDGDTIWGGELLLTDLQGFERLARLRPLRLPGGDASARDTRRCALALLHQAYGDDFVTHPFASEIIPDHTERKVLASMIRRNFNCVSSSGAGRVFDGITALLGLCDYNKFEAQAAITLEAEASLRPPQTRPKPLIHLDRGNPMEIVFAPLIRSLVEGKRRGELSPDLASRFHDQFALAWATAVKHWARETSVSTVALSGGVFCNQRLTESLAGHLERNGLRVLRHRLVPPNDGGLALGQAVIAATRFATCSGATRIEHPASAGPAAVEPIPTCAFREVTRCA